VKRTAVDIVLMIGAFHVPYDLAIESAPRQTEPVPLDRPSYTYHRSGVPRRISRHPCTGSRGDSCGPAICPAWIYCYIIFEWPMATAWVLEY